MAMDSIIARPTNKVRVMVEAASGCWASAVKAVETARPSPSAGAILPTAMVTPAQIIDTIAIQVMLSIGVLSLPRGVDSCCTGSRGCRDVHSGENAENVSLDYAR